MANMQYATEIDYISNKADVVIHALDVGGGDSILIQTSTKNYLIDTGGSSGATGIKSGNLLWNALVRYNARKLDGVIITHPHQDHDGNLPMLLDKVDAGEASISTVYYNGLNLNKESYRQFQYKQRLGTKLKALNTSSASISLGNGASLQTIWPTQKFINEMQRRTDNHIAAGKSIGETADDNGGGLPGNTDYLEGNGAVYSINNSSIVTKLIRGNFSMLLTGDAGRAVWTRYIGKVKESVAKANSSILSDRTFSSIEGSTYYKVYTKSSEIDSCSKTLMSSVTVYKAAHHSQNAANITGTITGYIKPECVIITCGNHQDPYPYPNSKAWNVLTPRIATIAKLSAKNDDEDDEDDEDDTSTSQYIPINRMFCTREQGDIHIGVFGSEYVVVADVPDTKWVYRWIDTINKSLLCNDKSFTDKPENEGNVRQYIFREDGKLARATLKATEVST